MPIPILETPYYTVYQRASDKLVVISFSPDATDATPSTHPLKTEKRIEEDGTIDYFDVASANTVYNWKHTIGMLLTKFVVKPELRRQGKNFVGDVDCSILLEFPSSYKLYTHKKGDRHDPRKDHYLVGSEYARNFRSPQEFFLHAKWLMEGKPTKANGARDCGCCYCDLTVTQSDIAKRFGTGHVSEKTKRKPRSSPTKSVVTTMIPAKDYTKLNV